MALDPKYYEKINELNNEIKHCNKRISFYRFVIDLTAVIGFFGACYTVKKHVDEHDWGIAVAYFLIAQFNLTILRINHRL